MIPPILALITIVIGYNIFRHWLKESFSSLMGYRRLKVISCLKGKCSTPVPEALSPCCGRFEIAAHITTQPAAMPEQSESPSLRLAAIF